MRCVHRLRDFLTTNYRCPFRLASDIYRPINPLVAAQKDHHTKQKGIPKSPFDIGIRVCFEIFACRDQAHPEVRLCYKS